MLSIRLARIGTNKRPFYRIIICERGRDIYGKALEILGTYNPFTKDLQVDSEKIKEWMSKGAQLTATLNNLFIDKKIIDNKKKVKTCRLNTVKLVKKREEGKKKEEEAKAAAAEAKKTEEEAAAKPEEAAPTAETTETPAVETSTEAGNKAENV